MNQSSPVVKVAVSSQSFSKDQRLRDEALRRFPDFQFEFCDPKTQWNPDSLSSFVRDADAWIVGKEKVDKPVLKDSNVKLVSKYGVGIDNVDFETCKSLGVAVYFEPGVNSYEVAEQAISFMIGLSRNLFLSSAKLRSGVWLKNGGANFGSKTVGIIGCGHVGEKVGRLAKAFSCSLLVNDIVDKAEFCREHGAEQVSLEEILERSDFLSLHVPLTELTLKMINHESLSKMKETAYLINTCRGKVVDESDLQEALENNRIAGAALDVFEEEPAINKGLISLDNFIGTAHIAGNSREAVWKMGVAALNGLENLPVNR